MTQLNIPQPKKNWKIKNKNAFEERMQRTILQDSCEHPPQQVEELTKWDYENDEEYLLHYCRRCGKEW